MKYNLVVCGGTFDHFHKGHEDFLNHALSLGGRLIVGLTSGDYVENSKLKKQNSKLIEDYRIRKKSLEKFLSQKNAQDGVKIVKIDDLFGQALDSNLPIDAIIVSEETVKGAEIINEKRKELGLKDLNILTAPSVFAEDGRLISSARIRNGEINRMGKSYVNPLWLKKDLVLPENLREEFQKPFGVLDFNVLKHHSQFSLTAVVGDVTAKLLNQLKLNQKISVVDFKVARKNKFSNLSQLGFLGSEKIFKIENPSGSLTPALFNACKMAWKENKRVIIQIEGEEDLAVLPLILAAPLNTVIYYGQPNTGLVRVLVSEENKDKAYELVSRF